MEVKLEVKPASWLEVKRWGAGRYHKGPKLSSMSGAH